jgi:hypothetical protein
VAHTHEALTEGTETVARTYQAIVKRIGEIENLFQGGTKEDSMRKKLNAWNTSDKNIKDSNVVVNKRQVKRLIKDVDCKRGKHKKTGCMEVAGVVKQERDTLEHAATMKKVTHLLEIIDKVYKTRTVTKNKEFPRTVAEAMGRRDWEKWKEAIKKEMVSIVKKGTFSDLQSKRDEKGKPLKTKIILTIKYNTDGSIERYKARFVILGNYQVYGDSYGETYAPVASMPSVRLFLNFAVQRDLPVHQLDIMTAFLNAPMDYEVDVHLDKETVTVMQELAREIGMKELDDNTRKRIAKACYGLKQAPRQFYKDLSGYLKEIGFESHPVEECLFKRQRNGKTMWLIIFVDDMLIIVDDTQEVIDFKQELTLKYELKD